MFNASGIVKDILNGSITYTDLLRDIHTLQQISSDAVNHNHVVNAILSMGCRLILDGDRIRAVPYDYRGSVNLPKAMNVKPDPIPALRSEPFVFLPNWEKVYARMEILVYGQDNAPITASPSRTILNLNSILTSQQRFPTMMVLVPVLELNTGTLRLLRISLVTFSQTPRELFNGQCIMRDRGARRRIAPLSVVLQSSYDPTEAIAANADSLTAMDSAYTDMGLTVEQAQMLRNLLDTRKYNPGLMQQALGRMHLTGR